MSPRKKDGPKARLSFFLAFLCALPASSPEAREDLFQAVSGLDPARDLGFGAEQARPTWPDRAPFPGFDTLPPAGASLSWRHHNLLRKKGNPGFALGGNSAAAGLRLDPMPGLSLHTALEREDLERNVGDTTLSVDHGSDAYESRTVAAFPLSPALVPAAGFAWTSQSDREHALLGINLRGRLGAGLSWTLSTGRRSLDLPLALDLPEYKPMRVPFLLRQDFHGLSVSAARGPVEIAWSGRLLKARRPDHQGTAYGLSDSGATSEQALRLAIGNRKASWPWKVETSLENGSGRHHFKGRSEDADGRYQFGYLEALQRFLATRVEGTLDRGLWRGRIQGGATALEWNAYRPAAASGKIFWDRNAVLDSYEGSLLGVFNKETWLMDGYARLLRMHGGAALERRGGGRWSGRLGLSWQWVDFSAHSHITKRTDVGILARSLEEVESYLPGVTAHLITPDLGLALRLGHGLELAASASQAIPVQVEIERTGGGSGGSNADGASAQYSGGTRAEIRIRYGWP